jgi:hypothetical protein
MKGTSEPLSSLSRNLAVVSVLLVIPAGAHAADDFSYQAGVTRSQKSEWPPSDAWSLSYRRSLGSDYLSSTISYLNDGHFPGHHRDGVTAEVWPQVGLFGQHLVLAVGAGPFYYYDTVVASNNSGYADSHGWAWLYSGAVTLYTGETGPFFEIRYDHTAPSKSIETDSLSVGFGYRMISDFRGGIAPVQADSLPANEVAGFYGHTQVNSFGHQESTTWAAEYRRRIWSEFRVSAGFLDEGDARLIRRSGFTYQGWLEPSFFDGTFSIGVGFGGYSAIDKYRGSTGRHVSDIVSLSLSYQLVQHVDARFTWNRIVTDYNRDTDIVLFGLGIRL